MTLYSTALHSDKQIHIKKLTVHPHTGEQFYRTRQYKYTPDTVAADNKFIDIVDGKLSLKNIYVNRSADNIKTHCSTDQNSDADDSRLDNEQPSRDNEDLDRAVDETSAKCIGTIKTSWFSGAMDKISRTCAQ